MKEWNRLMFSSSRLRQKKTMDRKRKNSPRRGIEPRSPAWQAGILTTILPRIRAKVKWLLINLFCMLRRQTLSMKDQAWMIFRETLLIKIMTLQAIFLSKLWFYDFWLKSRFCCLFGYLDSNRQQWELFQKNCFLLEEKKISSTSSGFFSIFPTSVLVFFILKSLPRASHIFPGLRTR